MVLQCSKLFYLKVFCRFQKICRARTVLARSKIYIYMYTYIQIYLYSKNSVERKTLSCKLLESKDAFIFGVLNAQNGLTAA